MIKVITMVGTSIFNNYLKKKRDIESSYKTIKDRSYDEYEEYKNQAEGVRRAVVSFYKGGYTADICAEIKSINKIKEYLKHDLQIFLLASDTIASYMAAEIIEELLIEEGFEVNFNPEHNVLTGLQVKDKERFINEGLSKLIRRVDSIAQSIHDGLASGEDLNSGGSYYGNMVFNISGGYKACIPYLTVMAQINGCDMYYIFEDTEALITIPSVPISIDTEIFAKYSEEFSELEEGIEGYNRWKQEHYEFVTQAASCIEVIDDLALLSPLGIILWANYNDRYVSFFTTTKVIKKIENNRILIEKVLKFMHKKIRDNKTEIKGVGSSKPFIYDDGNNNYRIKYRDIKGKIYICEVFDRESDQIKDIEDPTKSRDIQDYDFIPCSIDKATMKINYKE